MVLIRSRMIFFIPHGGSYNALCVCVCVCKCTVCVCVCACVFSSRWYLCTWKSPSCLSEVSPKLPLKQFHCLSDWQLPSLILSRKIMQCFLFPRLSLWGVNGVMPLALCPWVVSQASQHFRSSEKQTTWGGFALPARLSPRSFPFTPACPGQDTHRSFQRWPLTIDTFQCGLPIPPFVASSLNLWGYHVWSKCHLLKQSNGGHGWLLPPPLSSWTI